VCYCRMYGIFCWRCVIVGRVVVRGDYWGCVLLVGICVIVRYVLL